MFGLVEAIYSFILRQIGLRADTPDAAGSVHAKLGDIQNTLNVVNGNVFPVHKKTPTYTRAVMDNMYTQGEWKNMVNITGNRIIVNGSLIIYSSSQYVTLRMVIDGVQVIYNSLSSLHYPEYGYVLPYQYTNDSNYDSEMGVIKLDGIHFSQSFTIDLVTTSGDYRYRSAAIMLWHIPV